MSVIAELTQRRRRIDELTAENGRYRDALTQIRDATHKNALMLRAMADRALSVSTQRDIGQEIVDGLKEIRGRD